MENNLIKEDACVTASNSAGMGSVVAAQPSTNPGVTSGPDFAAGGGTIGSGDVSRPFAAKSVSKTKKKKKHIKKFDELFDLKQDYSKGFDRNPRIMKWENFNESLDNQ